MPLIKPFGSFLQRRFDSRPKPVATSLADVSAAVSDAALEAIDAETAHLIGRVIHQNRTAFSPPLPLPAGRLPVARDTGSPPLQSVSFEEMYARTKRLEGEILEFSTRLQAESLDVDDSGRLARLLVTIREAVHSAKSLKDIRHNLDDFQSSEVGVLADYLDHFRCIMIAFYSDLFGMRGQNAKDISFEDLVETIQSVRARHDDLHAKIFSDISIGTVRQADVSSLLNVNREILNANLALVNALSFYHLDPAQAKAFSRLPGIN